MVRSRFLLLATFSVLYASCAIAGPKRKVLSDHFFIEDHTRFLDPAVTHKLYVRTASGSSKFLASWWYGGGRCEWGVAIARDGRSVVYWGDHGISRYVLGREDSLLHPGRDLACALGRDGALVQTSLSFAFKDPARNAHGTPWVVDGEGRESPLVLQEASPLLAAAYQGNLGTVDSLIRAGADPDAQTPAGFTPLGVAILAGQVEVISRLLEAGGTPVGDGLVMDATLSGHWKTVEALLDRGGDPNVGLRSILGLEGRPAIPLPLDSIPAYARRFLERGANPNARNQGASLLHAVAGKKQWHGPAWPEVGKILIEHGADPNARDPLGNTPLILFACASYGSMPDRLKDLPAWENSAFHAFLETLVTHTTDLDARNAVGTTAVRGAIPNALPVARYLVAHGASDTVQVKGRSARKILAGTRIRTNL